MASRVGTTRALLAVNDQWKGSLMFVAQPAEEGTNGVRAMITDGLFKGFLIPDYAFALHTSPSPCNFVGYGVGAIPSHSDSLEITFKTRSGHGSALDKTIDPIAIAARFVTDVQTVASREKDPAEFGVVTIGAIQGDMVSNIIPDTVVLRGTIGLASPRCAISLLQAFGAPLPLPQ